MQNQTTENATELLARARSFVAARKTYLEGGDALEGMIMAAIAEGHTTRSEIVRFVPRLIGHSYAHVGMALTRSEGDDPTEHLWFRGDDKHYRLHSNEQSLPSNVVATR